MKFSQLTCTLRVAQARQREMWMKGTRLAGEPGLSKFVFDSGVQGLQTGGLRTDPENTRPAACWERAGIRDCQFKG